MKRRSLLLLAVLILISTLNQGMEMKKRFLPESLREDGDWSSRMAHVSEAPVADGVYYSNGIVTTAEGKDQISHQEFIVVQNSSIPDTLACRTTLIELDTIGVYDFATGESFTGSYDRMRRKRISYEGDRVVYDFEYHPLLMGHVEEYIPWESHSLVHRVVFDRPMKIKRKTGDRRIRFAVRSFGRNLIQAEYDRVNGCLHFFDTQDPFHVVVKSDKPVESYAVNPENFGIPTEGPYPNKKMERTWQNIGVLGFLFSVDPGAPVELNVVFSFGLTREEALAEAERVVAHAGQLDRETRKFWNEFYASCPLVVPESTFSYVNGATNRKQRISPEELIKSELWNWHGLLTDVCRARYLRVSPITVADWGEFVGMWANDGIEEVVALSYTNQWRLARECIINWFKYAVNYKEGDGHCSWTLYPSGLCSFDHVGASDEHTEGVPFQGRVVGHYIRATGDTSLLDEDLGERDRSRTLWQQLNAYENRLLEVRDANGDRLLDWQNMYETGWDNKHSPFIKKEGAITTSMNEQVFRLWSLSELIYLSKLKGEDISPWQEEMALIQSTVEKRLWSDEDRFYHDYDVTNDALWTAARNLDAFYWLYYERSEKRKEQLIRRLKDPGEFNASLLPTLSISNPSFTRNGYWDGRAWPREHAYVGVALSRAGYPDLGFQWAARAVLANLGPILPETLDPLADPVEKSFVGPCRVMGYNALNCLALVDISGLEMWDGRNLTLVPHTNLPRLCIVNQKYDGDRYDAVSDPRRGITLYRNGKEMGTFGSGAVFEFTHINDTIITLKVHGKTKSFFSLPFQVSIYIDGELSGKVRPRKKVPVASGEHQIKLILHDTSSQR